MINRRINNRNYGSVRSHFATLSQIFQRRPRHRPRTLSPSHNGAVARSSSRRNEAVNLAIRATEGMALRYCPPFTLTLSVASPSVSDVTVARLPAEVFVKFMTSDLIERQKRYLSILDGAYHPIPISPAATGSRIQQQTRHRFRPRLARSPDITIAAAAPPTFAKRCPR
jgi:hypothetical protein